jgi:hypothetical protein
LLASAASGAIRTSAPSQEAGPTGHGGWHTNAYGNEDVVALYKGKPFEGHKNNFYRCIREGGLPVSDVYSHVIAMNTSHLTAIAARLGRTIHLDPATEQITGDEQAAAMASRTPRSGYEIHRV